MPASPAISAVTSHADAGSRRQHTPAVAGVAVGAVVLLMAWSVFAFAAVYPWAWQPLLAGVAVIGALGIAFGKPMSAGLRLILIFWAVSGLAVAAQLIPIGRDQLAALSPAAIPLLTELDITFPAVSTHALSIDPALTTIALVFLGVWALFLAGLDRLMTGRLIETVTRSTLVIGLVLSIVGIVQRENLTSPLYGFWKPYGGTLNNFGPFVNRNHFAGWTVMACGLGLGYLFALLAEDTAERKWRSRMVWFGRREGTTVVLVTLALAVMMGATVWSMSRSGIICLVVVVTGMLLFAAPRRQALDGARKTTAIVVTLIAGAALWRGLDAIVAKFATPDSVMSRLAAWQDTWSIVKDFPIFGTGINTYTVATLLYQHSNEEWHLAEAHNDYLQLLSDGGLFVAIPAIVTVAVAVRAVWARWKAPSPNLRTALIQKGAAVGLVGIAVQEVVEFSLQKPANALLFVILLAIAIYEPGRSFKTPLPQGA